MIRAKVVLTWLAVAFLVIATVLLVGWRVHGGSWVRVTTPSMGTTAPVGSLLWIEPVAFDAIKPGDLVTFRPPGKNQTYSHLVTTVNRDHTLSTQGRITAPDPWRIGPDQVVGRTAWVWPGVGWLLVAAPVLAGGAVVLWLLVHRLPDRSMRLPVTVLGSAVIVTIAIVSYRPLLGAQQLSFTALDGTATATYVGTGLLPVRLSAPHGDSVVLGPGEVGSVSTTDAEALDSSSTRFTVELGPAIPTAWWIALVLACFAPAVGESSRALRRPLRNTRSGAVGGRHAVVH